MHTKDEILSDIMKTVFQTKSEIHILCYQYTSLHPAYFKAFMCLKSTESRLYAKVQVGVLQT